MGPGDFDPTYEVDEEFCYTYLLVWRVVVTGIICIPGVVGNTIAVVMFHAFPETGGSLSVLLKALSWADLLHVLLYANVLWWPDLAWHFFGGERIWEYSMYAYKYLYPFVAITLSWDAWFIVLISVHRYRAVSQPLKSAVFSATPRMYKQVLFVTIFTLLFEFPRFFEYKIVDVIDPQTNETIKWYDYTPMYQNEYYQLIYKSILVVCYKKYIPMVIITISAVRIIVILKKSAKEVNRKVGPSGTGHVASVYKVSRVPLTVMITFIVTQLPVCVYPIARLILEDEKRKTCSYFYLYATTFDVIGLINPSINCLFYLLLWESYRRNLMKCCSCSCSCGRGCSCCCSCCKTGTYVHNNATHHGGDFSLQGRYVVRNGEYGARSSDKVAISSDNVAKSSDKVAISSDKVAISSENVAISPDKFASNGANATINDVNCAKSGDNVACNGGAISMNDNDLNNGDNVATKGDNGMDTRIRGNIAKNGDDIAKNDDDVTRNGDNIARDGESVVVEGDSTANNRDNVARDGDNVARNAVKIARNSDNEAMNCNRVECNSISVITISL